MKPLKFKDVSPDRILDYEAMSIKDVSPDRILDYEAMSKIRGGTDDE